MIKRSVDEKVKNQLLGEEDEPFNLDSLSCMQTFTCHERCPREEMMIQKDIDVIERIENESYMETSSSNLMELKLKTYGSFKGQRNPLFEPSHQIENSTSKIFYDRNNHDKISNYLVRNPMEEFVEGSSFDVFTPCLCSK